MCVCEYVRVVVLNDLVQAYVVGKRTVGTFTKQINRYTCM